MFYRRLTAACGGVAAILTLCLPAHGGDIRLSVAGVDAQRRPTVSLTGLAAGPYRLEASTNLTDWFSLTSGAVGTGLLSFLHSDAPQLRTVFYRGLQLPDPTTILAVPQVDSNRVAAGVITLEHGGSLVLTNESGVRYAFTVGPANVLETVAVRMQLVTNFNSFPCENAMRTAVLFEPSGFEFHGAGLLEITYPTNVPFLSLSSFAFNAQGGGFHLTPDIVTTNRVQIPVMHFSGVGTGLFAPSARTTAITSFIDNSLDQLSHDLGASLARERDRQLAGEEPQTAAMVAEIQRHQQEFYDHYLKPFFAEAEKNCALAQTLMRHALGAERQTQLLGLTGSLDVGFLASTTTKAWACNCLQEAIAACQSGKISDKTLVRTVLGFERQAQLLGAGGTLESCGLGSLSTLMEQAQSEKLPCVPDWLGVVAYSDGGSRTWDCSGGSVSWTCNATASSSLSFEADVERAELTDESFLPFFSKQTWRLKLFPQASGSWSMVRIGVSKGACGSVTTTAQRSAGAGSGPLDLEAVFTFEDGELTEFTIDDSGGQGSLVVDAPISSTGVTTPCDTGGPGSSSSHLFTGVASLSPEPLAMEKVTFTKRTPLALEGTVNATRLGLEGIPMPYSWSFSLARNGP